MKNKMKFKSFLKKGIAILAAAILVFTFFALSGCKEKPVDDGSSISATQKTVFFKIVFEDKTEKTIQINTQKTILADALVEAGLIEYEKSGLYTTIDGVTADFSKDGAWWCITKGGEMLSFGLNDIKIADGERYEATYTK